MNIKRLPKVSVKKASLRGEGVFAKEAIKKGSVIYPLSGEFVTFDECILRIRGGEEAQDDSLQVGYELDMILEGISHFFNHSCEPNAGIRKISELVAIQDIKKGEEITFDYSATIGPNVTAEVWTLDCLCGSKKCRKVISNILSIPKKQLKFYRDSDALQDYIKRELDIIKINGGRPPKYKKIIIWN